MILDRIENAKVYLGINEELDKALETLAQMDFNAPVHERFDISEKAYYTYSERPLLPRRYQFEFHRKYIDIHVPVNTTEQIALCPSAEAPAGLDFDLQKDFALFDGKETYIVNVPAGWFCICFPDDAHEPLIGDENTIIKKVVFKVQA